MEKNKYSLGFVAFLQAAGLIAYCGLVAILFWQGNQLFGKVPSYLGPLLFLVLFTTSALICAIIVLYYPFILFWQKKQSDKALKVIIYTAGWLIVFTFLILTALFVIR
jgi:hypothetical protein